MMMSELGVYVVEWSVLDDVYIDEKTKMTIVAIDDLNTIII